MNQRLRIRRSYRPLWLMLVTGLMICGCQKDITQVISESGLDLVAPSGARIASSADELTRNIALIAHEEARQIKVLGINYVDTPSGYGSLIRYVNQQTKAVNQVAMFRYATKVSGRPANIHQEEVNYAYCSCGKNYVVSSACEPIFSKDEEGFSLRCTATAKAAEGCVGHMGTL